MKERCEYGDEVARALASKAPVVALETTVVTHGLPHPDGVTTALSLEQIVREAGATPATIGIIGGAIRIGLTRSRTGTTRDDTERRQDQSQQSRRGGFIWSARLHDGGGHDVRGTCKRDTGVRNWRHRRGASRRVREWRHLSDLTALSRIPVAVVCAGAKAILDLPRTVEMLETLGVPVFGFGTDEFPAFYRRLSGLPVDRRYDSITELASAVRLHLSLGLGTGVLVANPIPIADEMAAELYDRALNTALSEAEARRSAAAR